MSRGPPTFEHVLDENAALGDLFVDDELLVIGSDEENHCCWLEADGILELLKGAVDGGGDGVLESRRQQRGGILSDCFDLPLM